MARCVRDMTTLEALWDQLGSGFDSIMVGGSRYREDPSGVRAQTERARMTCFEDTWFAGISTRCSTNQSDRSGAAAHVA